MCSGKAKAPSTQHNVFFRQRVYPQHTRVSSFLFLALSARRRRSGPEIGCNQYMSGGLSVIADEFCHIILGLILLRTSQLLLPRRIIVGMPVTVLCYSCSTSCTVRCRLQHSLLRKAVTRDLASALHSAARRPSLQRDHAIPIPWESSPET